MKYNPLPIIGKTLSVIVSVEYSDATQKWLCHAFNEENTTFSGLALGNTREEAIFDAEEQVRDKYRALKKQDVSLERSVLKDEILISA